MVQISPFHVFRPRPEFVAQVASVPYDVISRSEGRKKGNANPYSFLHVARPDIDFSDEWDPKDPQVLEHGKKEWERLKKSAFLEETQPQLFLYQLRYQDHQQTGIVCCASLEDYAQNRIKKHEKTRKDKEEDRVLHIQTLSAHDEPCFLFYKTHALLKKLVDQELNSQNPLYDFTAEDGILHRVYPISQPNAFVQAFQTVPELYVADGHHRTQASYLIAESFKKQGNSTGKEPIHHFLNVIFPQEELKILPYNRVVQFPQASPQFFQELQKRFPLVESPLAKGVFRLYWKGKWSNHRIPSELCGKTPVERLDVAVLQKQLLEPWVGIQDPRTDQRIHFVGGIHGEKELVRFVQEENYHLALSLFPVAIQELIEIADAGEILPPKSTWFEPKLRSGLFVHPF